jgi:putative DNA primase/helicase
VNQTTAMLNPLPLFPAELKSLDRWGCFKLVPKADGSGFDKVPYDAATGRKANLFSDGVPKSLADAAAGVREFHLDGIGYGFQAQDGITGIDLDKVRDPKTGEIQPWAREIIRELNTYAEVSPSGKGIHLYARGRVLKAVKQDNVELYCQGRFFTVTGEHLDGTPLLINEADVQSLADRVKARRFAAAQGIDVPTPAIADFETHETDPRKKKLDDWKRRVQMEPALLRGYTAKLHENTHCPFHDPDGDSPNYKSHRSFAFVDGVDGYPIWKCTSTHCTVRDGNQPGGDIIEFVRFYEADEDGVPMSFIDALSLIKDEYHEANGTLDGDDFTDLQIPSSETKAGGLDGASTNYLTPPSTFDDSWARTSRSDLGNSERFVHQHNGEVLNCPQRAEDASGWMAYDGTKWETDASKLVMRAAKLCAVNYLRDVQAEYKARMAEADESERKKLQREMQDARKFGKASLSRGKLEAMVSLAGAGTLMCVSGDRFDQDPWLINVLNGTIDGRTGEFRQHRKEDYLTMQMDVVYDPTATCPTWTQFVNDVMSGDPELVAYVRRVVGYLLVGAQSEQCFFILYGVPGTGKSTFWKVIRALLGDYAGVAAPGLFVESGLDRNDGSNCTPGLAALVGKRVVMASEMSRKQKFASELLKTITGDGVLTARRPHSQLFTFESQCKPVFLTNYIPSTEDFSGGLARRMRIVKFENKFTETDAEIKDYDQQLIKELPGILHWALGGLLEIHKLGGLREPASMKHEVAEYVANQDTFSMWVADMTEKAPGAFVSFKDLKQSFTSWAIANAEESGITPKTFAARLKELGFKPDKSNGVRGVRGIKVRPLREPSATDDRPGHPGAYPAGSGGFSEAQAAF